MQEKIKDDAISRQAAIDALEAQERQYTFGNDEFNLEAAYHDCKMVFDGITDDDSFQEADTGLILYYANEIIYALHEALEGKDTNVLSDDCISRRAAIEALKNSPHYISKEDFEILNNLPSAQPEVIYCENCKHGVHAGRGDTYLCVVSPENTAEHKYNFWCAYAERRE